MDASVEELEEIFEIGNIMAKSIVDFFSNSHTQDVINKLKAAGVNLSTTHNRDSEWIYKEGDRRYNKKPWRQGIINRKRQNRFPGRWRITGIKTGKG